jgi:putative flippase GtrA
VSSNQRPEARSARSGGRFRELLLWIYEAAKFGTVGAIAYLVDNGAYVILTEGPGRLMADWPVRASVVASLIATAVSYVGNRYWTFSRQRSKMPVKEVIWFFAANAIGILITGGCLYFSRWILDLHGTVPDLIARNVGIVLGTIFRYVAYKFWVFRAGPNKPSPDAILDAESSAGAQPDPAPGQDQPVVPPPDGELNAKTKETP